MDRGSAGRNGGRTTYERYGPEHMAEIGKRGFLAVVNRYSGGDAAAAKDRLHLQAAEGQIDRLVPDKLNSGEETCVEMLEILDPETIRRSPSQRSGRTG